MNILILGASSETSIGFAIGEILKARGHNVTCASRSGKIGSKCDVTDPVHVRRIVRKSKPDAVVFAAGVFAVPRDVGTIKDWRRVRAHVNAKSIGALIVANELARLGEKRSFIALGGRDISSHAGFASFTVGNGALWSLVRFLNATADISAYFFDLPFVSGSTMQRQYLMTSTRTKEARHGIPVEKVARAIERIFSRPPRRKRIVLGDGTT